MICASKVINRLFDVIEFRLSSDFLKPDKQLISIKASIER
jgi:hypothetical protein